MEVTPGSFSYFHLLQRLKAIKQKVLQVQVLIRKYITEMSLVMLAHIIYYIFFLLLKKDIRGIHRMNLGVII